MPPKAVVVAALLTTSLPMAVAAQGLPLLEQCSVAPVAELPWPIDAERVGIDTDGAVEIGRATLPTRSEIDPAGVVPIPDGYETLASMPVRRADGTVRGWIALLSSTHLLDVAQWQQYADRTGQLVLIEDNGSGGWTTTVLIEAPLGTGEPLVVAHSAVFSQSDRLLGGCVVATEGSEGMDVWTEGECVTLVAPPAPDAPFETWYRFSMQPPDIFGYGRDAVAEYEGLRYADVDADGSGDLLYGNRKLGGVEGTELPTARAWNEQPAWARAVHRLTLLQAGDLEVDGLVQATLDLLTLREYPDSPDPLRCLTRAAASRAVMRMSERLSPSEAWDWVSGLRWNLRYTGSAFGLPQLAATLEPWPIPPVALASDWVPGPVTAAWSSDDTVRVTTADGTSTECSVEGCVQETLDTRPSPGPEGAPPFRCYASFRGGWTTFIWDDPQATAEYSQLCYCNFPMEGIEPSALGFTVTGFPATYPLNDEAGGFCGYDSPNVATGTGWIGWLDANSFVVAEGAALLRVDRTTQTFAELTVAELPDALLGPAGISPDRAFRYALDTRSMPLIWRIDLATGEHRAIVPPDEVAVGLLNAGSPSAILVPSPDGTRLAAVAQGQLVAVWLLP